MHKGLYSALWVLFFTLITACGSKPDPIPEPPSQISVSGRIMLGPIVRGHSLKLVIYDADMKELDRPKVGLDGSYGFKLKDYKGIIIAQVTSENPDQCSGDYIDEATAKPKCLGKSTILSSTYVQSGTSDNQAKLHTTPVTTVAVLHAGVVLDDNGGLTVPKGLTQDRIIQSNKAVAKVFGLGDQSIAEYTPTSIITTDQKFKTGDAYTKALAAISGVEAIDNTKNLNNILKQISSAISTDTKNPALNPALQDTMVKGLQKVAEKIKADSGDKTILKNLSEYQDKFHKSIVAVDLTKTLPEPPSFTDKTKTKTTILKPTWHWKPDNTGNTKYQYRVGEADRTWKDIAKNKFTPSENLKRGKHTLIIRQANVNKATLWSKPSQLTIEIVPNTKGDVSITGTFEEHQKLTAEVFDRDGEATDISYQWYRNEQKIPDTNKSDYTLVRDDIGKVISVKVMYKDKEGNNENITYNPNLKIKNVNDDPDGTPIIKGTAKQGETLTVDTDQIIDKDGFDKSTFTYQWYEEREEDRIPITGKETKKTLTLEQAHVDKKLSVIVSFKDKGDKTEFIPSLPTPIVKNVNDDPDGTPIIKGTAKQGETLTVDTDQIIDKDGIDKSTFTYQWYEKEEKGEEDTVLITGETKQTLKLEQTHVNKKLSVIVSFKDNGDKTEFIPSLPTLMVENINDRPTIQSNSSKLKATENTVFEYQVNVIDKDGDQDFTFEFSGQPDDMDVDKSQGKVSWKPGDEVKTGTVSFTVSAKDKSGAVSEPKTFDIDVAGLNDPPVAKSFTVDNILAKNIYKELDLLKNISDPDNDNLQIIFSRLPQYGELKFDGKLITLDKSIEISLQKTNSQFIYNRTKNGKDTFEFKLNDGKSESSVAIVDIEYTNLIPTAESQIINLKEHETKVIDLTYSDDQDQISKIVIDKIPKYGSLEYKGTKVNKQYELDKNHSELTYISNKLVWHDDKMVDKFTFTVYDQDGLNHTGEIKIEIESIVDGFEIIQLNDQNVEFIINMNVDDDDDMMNIADPSYSFAIKHDTESSIAFGHLRYRTSYDTKNVFGATSWLEEESFNFATRYDLGPDNTHHANLYLKSDRAEINNSVRVIIPVTDYKKSHKYAFINKPTKVLNDNFKKQANTSWVDVCWHVSEEIDKDNNQIEATKTKIIETITKSWEQYSALKFDWRNTNNWLDSHEIEKFFEWGTENLSNCKDNYTVNYPQIQVHLKTDSDRYSDNEKVSDSANNIVSIPINTAGAFANEWLDSEFNIIHEFGHALGFPDENTRPDSFLSSTSDKHVCNKVPNTGTGAAIIADDENIFGNIRVVKEISFKEWQKQPYNPISIMNECITGKQYYSEKSDTNKQDKLLSVTDIKRVQQFYGAPENGTPHLLLNDQFFTGLYLESGAYHYYENGIKNTEYEPVTETEIKAVFSNDNIDMSMDHQKAFVIYNKDEATSVLFNDKFSISGTLSSFMEPNKSILSACKKPASKRKVELVTCPDKFDLNNFLNLDLDKNEKYTIEKDVALYYEIFESNEDNNRLILHACDVNAFIDDPSSGKKIQKIALTNNNLSCVKKVPDMHYLNNFLLKKKFNSNYDYFFRGESINNTADFFFIKPLNPDLI